MAYFGELPSQTGRVAVVVPPLPTKSPRAVHPDVND
jgi:hypothetical protein